MLKDTFEKVEWVYDIGLEVVQRPAPRGGVINANGKLFELLTDFDAKQSPTSPYFGIQEVSS